MEKKKSTFPSVISILVTLIFTSTFLISCSSDGKGNTGLPNGKAGKISLSAKKAQATIAESLLINGGKFENVEAEFRVGALGGTVEVVDPQSPIFGAGVTFPINSYRDNNAPYILQQWSGGTISKDAEGNRRILTPTGKDPNFNTSRATPLQILVLQVNDGSTDTFPTFLVKEFDGSKFTTFSDLPDLTLPDTQLTDTDVTCGTGYTYTIRANNSIGSTDSDTVPATAKSDCADSAPGSFTLKKPISGCSGTNPQIKLEWEASTGAAYYEVFRNDQEKAIGKVSGTQFNDASVTPGTEYTYFIKATNCLGSTTSNTVKVTATSSADCAFILTATTACVENSPQINLSWSSLTDAISYNIYRDGKAYKRNIDKPPFVDTDVAFGSKHTYFVRAKIRKGKPVTSNIVPVDAKRSDSKPGSFTLTATPVCGETSAEIKLGWTASTGAASYDIFRDGILIKRNVTDTQFTDTKLASGTEYTYKVTAKNCAGSTDSTEVKATEGTTTAPASFTLTATPECNGTKPQIKLKWKESEGATSYDIYRDSTLYKKDVIGTKVTESTDGTETVFIEFTDDKVTSGTAYTYHIQAKNCIGTTDSDTASVTAKTDCGDTSPGNFTLKATPQCSSGKPRIKLEWDESDGATSYDLYRDNTLYKSDLTGTEFINTNVTAGTSYTYFLRAKKGDDLTTDSNTVTETAKSDCVVSKPGSFTLTATPDCSGANPVIKLKWADSSGATSYDIYRNSNLYKSDVRKTVKTIKLVQLLEPPMFTIQIPGNLAPLIPENVQGLKPGSNETVIGVGFPILFNISDQLHQGSISVGGLSPSAFKKAVTIKIPYSKDAVTKLGIKASKLRLYGLHFSLDGFNTWRNIPIKEIDEKKGIVSAKVKEFSIFQVVAPFKEKNSLPIVSDYTQEIKTKGETTTATFRGVTTTGEKGNIEIRYNILDAEGDPSDVLIEWRANPGVNADEGWKPVGGKTITQKNVSPGVNSFKWNSALDTGSVSGFFQVRVTPIQKIAGKKLIGGRGYSDIFRINNSSTTISPPTDLAGAVKDTTPPQVSLNWKPSSSSGVSGYNIYRQARFDSGFEKTFREIGKSTSPVSSDGTITFFDDTITSSFYEIIYKLTAFDSSGNESNFSDTVRLASIVFSGYGYGR